MKWFVLLAFRVGSTIWGSVEAVKSGLFKDSSTVPWMVKDVASCRRDVKNQIHCVLRLLHWQLENLVQVPRKSIGSIVLAEPVDSDVSTIQSLMKTLTLKERSITWFRSFILEGAVWNGQIACLHRTKIGKVMTRAGSLLRIRLIIDYQYGRDWSNTSE